MHGRPRPPKGCVPSEEQIEKLRKKTRLLKSATDEVLEKIKHRNFDKVIMSMSAKLLKLNPEIYTAWNYRRDALNQLFQTDKVSHDEQKSLLVTELGLIADALNNNPKSYGSWHHRQWVISKGMIDLESEFVYIDKKLDEDSRNFHAWNYRMFLARIAKQSSEEELAFSQKKIEQNFSNYSAWHHRSLCLQTMYQSVPIVSFQDLLASSEAVTHPQIMTPSIPITVLETELEMLHSAFVTDPEDSSAWLYYRWLISSILDLRKDSKEQLVQVKSLLESERKLFQSELIPLDPKSKWILLTYALLLEVEGELEDKPDSENIMEIYEELMKIDPMRKGFYKDLKNKQASIVIKSMSF